MDASRSALAVSRLPRAAHEPTPTPTAGLLGSARAAITVLLAGEILPANTRSWDGRLRSEQVADIIAGFAGDFPRTPHTHIDALLSFLQSDSGTRRRSAGRRERRAAGAIRIMSLAMRR